MTRFEKEYKGLLGEFWQKEAKKEIKRLLNMKDEIIVEEDGAAKWKSNGNYLPSDVVEKLVFGDADWFSPEATEIKRDIQTAEQIAEYRRNRKPMSEEALFEARAAFGVGTTIVDVFTGERITL